jgi:hypothetical protein
MAQPALCHEPPLSSTASEQIRLESVELKQSMNRLYHWKEAGEALKHYTDAIATKSLIQAHPDLIDLNCGLV